MARATARNTPSATQSSATFTLNVQNGGVKTRVQAGGARSPVTTAAMLPPTTPATTTASTSTRAGVARVTCVRTGNSAADATTTVAVPRAMPRRGAPPVGGRRFINTNLDAILMASGGPLTVP